MRTVLVLAGAVVAAALVGQGSAAADHMKHVAPSGELLAPDASASRDAAPTREPAGTLDLELKVGKDTFRLGGRVFGSGGVAGAWLNGQVRPDGFALDGRIQNEAGRAYNFKVNADMLDFMTRSAWRILLGIPTWSPSPPSTSEQP
ncbi:MAG: hypothetical protein HYU41_20125 [Candidatus Rokubacteria bacterium]|nr:hypothetical protein [Candidatus Rokubacteria bacterium]